MGASVECREVSRNRGLGVASVEGSRVEGIGFVDFGFFAEG